MREEKHLLPHNDRLTAGEHWQNENPEQDEQDHHHQGNDQLYLLLTLLYGCVLTTRETRQIASRESVDDRKRKQAGCNLIDRLGNKVGRQDGSKQSLAGFKQERSDER